jgi:hypothetical protein
MRDKEALQMLARCREEIVTLRKINAELAPKADAYDRMAQMLDMMPRRSQGMGEDILWIIDREAGKLRAAATETSDQDAK